MNQLVDITKLKKTDYPIHHAENCNLEQVAEQIRLSYAHVLKRYMQLLKRFKQMKENITDDDLKRNIHLVDNLFFDETGKVSWDAISDLMPPNLEKNIKNKYAMLNENEIKLCCLALFEVDPKNMNIILPISPNSVYVLKSASKKFGYKSENFMTNFLQKMN